jgi:hypothetical protein
MRFVDDEETWPSAMQRVPGRRVRELLRGHENERVGIETVERGRPRSRGLLRVQDDRGQARLAQMGKLIVLQRDQRRHDHRRPVPQQAGELVDRRLAAAGRQHREHVAPAARRNDGA